VSNEDEETERTVEVSFEFRRQLIDYLKIEERFAEMHGRSFAIVLFTSTGKKPNFVAVKEKSE
jgi:hypothetical protein